MSELFGITTNTLIGWSYLVMIPPLALWSGRSTFLWIKKGRHLAWDDYRLVVTVFLYLLMVNVLDIAWLRFKRSIGPLAPNPNSWSVVVMRWTFAISIIWGTVVIYRIFFPYLWMLVRYHRRKRRIVAVNDPYLDD